MSKKLSQRFCEYFAAFVIANLGFLVPLWSAMLTCYLMFFASTNYKIFIYSYIIYIIFDNNEENTTRIFYSNWLRSLKIWKHVANYFPIKLIKTVDLPPDRNYLFVCHPHGVIPYGIFTHFSTEGTEFGELFPGINRRLSTLSCNFSYPFFRQLILGWNFISSKYSSLLSALTQSSSEISENSSGKFTSNGIALVVGGSFESLLTKKFTYKIYIKKRKGFIKLAFESGASIVPVFSFGENDSFDLLNNDPGTLMRRYQELFKKITGIVPFFMSGRGFLHYFGFIPGRSAINTVVGSPIYVVKYQNPSQEMIDELHGRYMDAIQELFDIYKLKYVKNAENVELEMF